MWDDNKLWIPKILNGEEVNMTVLYSEDGQKVDTYLEQ